MDYAKPISSAKFYAGVIGTTLFMTLGFKALQNKITLEQVSSIITLALSIILQALPFILIGVLASSLIRLFVREEWIAKFAPGNGLAGVVVGGLLGLFFPVCDCGVMPVARSLLRKGVSMQTTFAYLLTAPVINPLVILATALAFQWNWHFVALRVLGTFVVGAIIAFLVGNLFSPRDFGVTAGKNHHQEHHSQTQTIHELFLHAVDEFFDIGGYLIISAFLAAAIQVWLPKGMLFQFVDNPYLAIGAMMILAISMSLCSEADAFVARVLANQFPLGSVFAFLLIGQILDLRNIVLFSRNFRMSLFVFIAAASIILTFLWGLGLNFILGQRIL
ncbi:permease [Desulfosporosinus sp. PR]|uniref:permease n=1 Tax=Candidatus Desulfosporosinus nitrosoreducens TaxID=3401928 RepID=UPI0027E90BA6|nr:permease [Desulfosporosinus sp. PR]MDQ7093778.1 permease [Desulfosporosinus sp. PR]